MGANFQDDFAHGAYLLWGTGATVGTPQTGNNSGPGILKFDIITSEEVTRDADIVTYPVEQGADVADHFRRKNRIIKLEAFISQEPLDPTLYGQSGNGQLLPVQLAIPSYPTTLQGTIAQAIVNPLGAGVKAANALFAGAPNQSFQALQFPQSFDSLAVVLGILDQLYANATLLDVATRSAYYANHLLGQCTTKRDPSTGTGTIITLELREVRFAQTQTVGAPPLPAQAKDRPNVSKGVQNPVPVPKGSLAYNLIYA